LPLYPYRCTQCGHRFEKIQHFSDEPETVCPKCGGVLERPLTVPGFQFKGAGWYVNDYAPKSSGAGGEASAGEKAEKKSETKTEAKPETKAASGGESSGSSSAGSSTSSSSPATTSNKSSD
jgi:putative FmdB family regulatory protein